MLKSWIRQGLVKVRIHIFLFALFCSELPGIGKPNWYLLSLLSPYAGIYYWQAGDRVDECSFKLVADDDEKENSISVLGPEEEIERMWRQLEWQEKGMVKVEGLLAAE